MKKEQKEMWKNWKSWKGFNDRLNQELKEDYIKKGILPPFTNPYGDVFSRVIPRECLDECPKNNCLLVKMTGIHWEFDTNLERKTYVRDFKADEFDFLKEAIVQIDLDLSLKKVSDDIIPNVLWETLCDADIGPWQPICFEYEVLNRVPSRLTKISCLYGNCKIVEDWE